MSGFTQHAHDNPRLNIELDTQQCSPADLDLDGMQADVALLEQRVDHFPKVDLFVTVRHNARSGGFHVKSALVLPSRTLVTGDTEPAARPAFSRCVRKLVQRLEGHEAALSNEDELRKQAKGTHQTLTPDHEPDHAALADAVRRGDYAAFREHLYAYEEPLRKRIGRWVQRYPDLDARIGADWWINDIVEEVFLNAFERFDQRPQQRRMALWLEDLIDPSIRLLREHGDEELANISFVRTLRGDDTRFE